MAQETILITGSNGGIGSGLVRYLLSAGFTNLACHYRSSCSTVEAVLGEASLPPERHLFQAELTDETQVRAMVQAVEERIGPVAALLNVAGASSNGLSWKLSAVEFRRVLEANLMSAFLCAREVIPGMRARGSGRIVNFSSVVGATGVAGAAHYAAAKAGLVGLTKSLALELAARGITVNAIGLGYMNCGLIDDVPEDLQQQIRTRIPVGRFGEVQELGALVRLLLGHESAFLTGQLLHLNGGQI